MAIKKSGKGKKVSLKLTDEQIAKLQQTFGDDFVKDLRNIEIDKISDFLRATMKFN